MTRLIALALPLAVCASLAADDPKAAPKKGIEGIWQGTLAVGAVELRLTFKITKKEDGTLTTAMDSVDQGAKDVPVESTTFADNKLTLKMPAMKATYTGTLQPDGDTIKGELDQVAKLPLELKRTDKPFEVNRPQHPKKPYPYVEELVTFPSKAREVTLAGTFTSPKGDGPFPAAILITGSGPQDRDESLLGHKPFLVLADHLTRQGIAVLRYDDRGRQVDRQVRHGHVEGLRGRRGRGGRVPARPQGRGQDRPHRPQRGRTDRPTRRGRVEGRRVHRPVGRPGHLGGGNPARPGAAPHEGDGVRRQGPDAPEVAPGKAVLPGQGRGRRGQAQGGPDGPGEGPVRVGEAANERATVGGPRPDREAGHAVVQVLPRLRPAADASEGDVPGPGPERGEGLAGPGKGEPRGDRPGPEDGREHGRDGEGAAGPQPFVPADEDRTAERVRQDRDDLRPGGAGGDQRVDLEAEIIAGKSTRQSNADDTDDRGFTRIRQQTSFCLIRVNPRSSVSSAFDCLLASIGQVAVFPPGG